MGKYLSRKAIAIARHEQEIFNSLVNRGEIDLSKSVRSHFVVCGCGAEGCGFVAQWKKEYPQVIDLEQQKHLYEQWLEHHQESNTK